MNEQTLAFVRLTTAATFTALLSGIAAAAPFLVTGPANIYGAGHAVAPNPGGGGAGVLPFEHSFAAGAGQVLQLSGVTGAVDCIVVSPRFTADGGHCVSASHTAIQSFGGISGINSTGRQMYLGGVFTDGTEPADPAPAALTYLAGDYSAASYAPLLNQVFFIGDGLTGTGSGATQQFLVPTTASRLYLGFADAFNFGDDTPGGRQPGFYQDNVGTLTGELTIGARQAPVPGTLAVLALGLGALALARRRRS